MSVFQFIGLTVFGLLAAINLRNLLNGRAALPVSAAWLILTCAGAGMLLAPDESTRVARALGIRRGADLLLYTSVLSGLVITFLIYTRMLATDRQITLIVRELAIGNARKPSVVEVGIPDPIDGFGPEVDFFDGAASEVAGSPLEGDSE